MLDFFGQKVISKMIKKWHQASKPINYKLSLYKEAKW